jgi:hypothetical protein
VEGRAGAESGPRSQPESLGDKVLKALVLGPLSKAELSEKLGQKVISGQLNKTKGTNCLKSKDFRSAISN